MPFDELHEECGVFAVKDSTNAFLKCVMGLHALQHRGQESCGVLVSHDGFLNKQEGYGYVSKLINKQGTLDNDIPGDFAIGHVRYTTSGVKLITQPILANCKFGEIGIAHNGNLIKTKTLREKLINVDRKLESDIDTELIAHLIVQESNTKNFLDSVISALQNIEGAYSLAIMSKDALICARDPSGIRPLVLGRLKDAYVVASETCAFDVIEAELIREIEPGELIEIDKNNDLKSYFPFKKAKSSFCIFEYIYFSHPNSAISNKSMYEVRKEIGRNLARNSPPPQNTDIVVPVPDSGIPAAMGYATKLNIPLEFAIIRNHYVGRTFIQPTDKLRSLSVELKYNVNSSLVENKTIVLIDDSLVRGTTLKKIISLLRKAKTKEIHLRISSPPTISSCFYGIDTPEKSNLISVQHSIDEMIRVLDCDSIEFLSIDDLYKSVINEKRNNKCPQYCDACFTGFYPIGKDY